MKDKFNLERFLDAQDGVFDQVVKELAAGQKLGHWMWYIFPQITGLGRSFTAQRYAISCREEAVAYIGHPILGDRLRQCTRLVNSIASHNIEQIFGYPDNLKFRSSMTLFKASSVDNDLFREALKKYFGGNPDQLTLNILKTLQRHCQRP